jgi:hypothetical protein
MASVRQIQVTFDCADAGLPYWREQQKRAIIEYRCIM